MKKVREVRRLMSQTKRHTLTTLTILLTVLLSTPVAHAEEQKVEEEKFPLSVDISLSNTVGTGTFLPGYRRVSAVGASLSLDGTYVAPAFSNGTAAQIVASTAFDYTYTQSYQSMQQEAQNRIRPSDLTFTISVPKALNAKKAGVTLTPKVVLIAPISMETQALGRVLSLGAGASLGWKGAGFSVSLAPTFTGHIYGLPGSQVPCLDGTMPNLVNPHDPDFRLEKLSLPTGAAREDEALGNGVCIASGRRSIGTLKNAVSVGYTNGAHNIAASITWYVSFLQPLRLDPSLSSPNASGNSFSELSMGRVAYTYTIPVSVDLSVSTGIMSYQGAYGRDGMVRFPFFDFNPGNNNTQVFLDVNVSI